MSKKNSFKIECHKVQSVLVSFKDINKSEYISITEWGNGEGFDLNINDQIIAVTWMQWEAIKKGINKLFIIEKEERNNSVKDF